MAIISDTLGSSVDASALNDGEFVEAAVPQRSNGADGNGTRILVLSSSLLVDRVLLHTSLLRCLNEVAEIRIWAASKNGNGQPSPWTQVDTPVEPFPSVSAFKEFPYNYFKRLNEYAWDYRLRPPSRLSIQRHVRNKGQRLRVRLLKPLGLMLAKLHAENYLEGQVQSLLLSSPIRSSEGFERLREYDPTLIVSSGPFQFEQPALFEAARKLGIPTIAYIPSWDNISTKNRMVYRYDGYIAWSEQVKRELHEFYPSTKDAPVYVIGAPQFDVFFDEQFYQSREDFCQQQGLDASLPIVVYALGSPNFLQEHHGAVEFAKRVAAGEIGHVQLLIRPHPIHDNAEMKAMFDNYGPLVRLQESPNAGIELTRRSQDTEQITEWINTFRHSDVVINLSSTVTVDAAIFDKPVVNLDFDPQPSKTDQQLVKDINHKWNHFKPIAESGGVWLVNDFDEMVEAVKTYLREPELHSEKRKWVAEYVCGYVDGRCGERMAKAIHDFAVLTQKKMAETARVQV